MLLHNPFTLLAAQVALAVSLPAQQQGELCSPTTSVESLFSLPSIPSWLENLAYRPSTDTILATRLNPAQLWSISTTTGVGTLLANVTDITALLGITQTRSSPDEFYIAGVNSSTTAVQPNSSVLWRVAFEDDKDGGPFTFEKAFGIPGLGLVNGLTTWDERTILAADSHLGAIWKIDVITGDATIVLQDPSMTPIDNNGANGVKILRPGPDHQDQHPQHHHQQQQQKTYVYYTSTDRGMLARIPVDPTTALPTAPSSGDAGAEIIATGLGEADDFALLEDGGVVLATGRNNTVVRIGLDGSVRTIAGSQDSLELASATACQFGARSANGTGRTLYVTTAGGEEGSVNGTYAAGSVVVVQLGGSAEQGAAV